MAPVARTLAHRRGVLEPFQTKDSLDGQVEELQSLLNRHGDPPLTLVGSSWGAMLALITAARHPALTAKIILVGSGVYEDQYAAGIMETRLNRLSDRDRLQVATLLISLDRPETPDKDELMSRLGALITKADAYHPTTLDTEVVSVQYHIHVKVWEQAARLRSTGGLLELARKIQCPVVAIHGDYDPHPAQGVEAPLSAVVKDFRFHLLKNCGHLPWLERQAAAEFYKLLQAELSG
jgi:pimeloyl-ACP methyl ester carboxylesterase